MLGRISIPTLIYLLSVIYTAQATYQSYDNGFVDANVILAKGWNSSFSDAEATVVEWADELAALGPWSVMNKAGIPPSGDKHDYMSWAPYAWPDCSKVGNKTALTPEQIWTTCPYSDRDGVFNPDRLLVNDTSAFSALADAVLYNSIAWVVTNESAKYSINTVNFIKTWFIDDATKMNPNLNYAQMERGPNGQVGQHYGILDLHFFTKIVTGVEILRKGNSPDWTSDIDAALVSWAKTYTNWLETSALGIGERNTTNNHGTFYYNQLAALKILSGDLDGALSDLNAYFAGIYKGQIAKTGEQPLEAARTRPYHYRAYNLAAMTTNARLSKYASKSSDPWNATTTEGANIKTAMDFLISLPVPQANDAEYADDFEVYLPLANVASVYGDPDARYTAFLKAGDPNYVAKPWFLWTQPLWNQNIAVSATNTVVIGPATTGKSTTTKNSANSQGLGKLWLVELTLLLAVCL